MKFAIIALGLAVGSLVALGIIIGDVPNFVEEGSVPEKERAELVTERSIRSINKEEEPAVLPEAREGSVIISSVQRNESPTSPQSITLRARLSAGEEVNVTGWRIESNSRSFLVPQAVDYYRVDSGNIEGDIILKNREEVKIYLDKGVLPHNLRLNKCTGYLSRNYDTKPSLPKNCPQVPRESYVHLSGSCQNYIRSIGRCELPDPAVTNTFRGSEGNECRSFVNSVFNAGYCYENYGNNPDFLSDEWWVWVDRDILDPLHDRIRLYNREGKLIDEFIY